MLGQKSIKALKILTRAQHCCRDIHMYYVSSTRSTYSFNPIPLLTYCMYEDQLCWLSIQGRPKSGSRGEQASLLPFTWESKGSKSTLFEMRLNPSQAD